MFVGGDQVTVTELYPGVAVPIVGAPGTTLVVVAVAIGEDAVLAPNEFIAFTVKLYWMPGDRLVTTTLNVDAPSVDPNLVVGMADVP